MRCNFKRHRLTKKNTDGWRTYFKDREHEKKCLLAIESYFKAMIENAKDWDLVNTFNILIGNADGEINKKFDLVAFFVVNEYFYRFFTGPEFRKKVKLFPQHLAFTLKVKRPLD